MPVPINGEEFTFYNPDGSEIRVRGWGDQFHAVFETPDGYTVVQDSDSGYFHYARLSDDETALVPTETRVDAADPSSLGLAPHLRVSAAAAKRTAASAQEELPGTPRWETRRAQRRQSLRGEMEPEADGEPHPAATVGSYVGLCLLIAFPDVTGTISQQEVSNFCNQSGYAGYGNSGSVKDYFTKVSGAKLTYTNVVTAYYTAQHNRAYYTDPNIAYGTRAQELIAEALADLKAKGFDFSPLSADASGYVYALNVFYAGPTVNNWSQGLWPHSWGLATKFVGSATRKFSDYQITNMGSQLTLRTFCHENGHMVCDYPDLYDYGGQSYGVGNFCLMCYGGSNTNPVEVCAYLKNKAGWATKLTTITSGLTATLPAGTNEFLIHKKSSTEYFILENRQQSGRDASLPDSGLAIWHVDELGSNGNEQMTAAQHYECSLEQADNRFDMEKKVNAGDGDDLFGAPTKTAFGVATAPDSKWWDGSDSGLEITQVSAPGATITVTTKGLVDQMASIVGTWPVVAVDWGCTGAVLKAGPFTFNSNGTWSYAFGGGRWFQVGATVVWNFTNAPGLVYTGSVNADAIEGSMGYATPGGISGCFYALHAASPSPAADLASLLAQTLGGLPESTGDVATAPDGNGSGAAQRDMAVADR